MLEETAKFLTCEGGVMREDYSGRGMYKRTVIAVYFASQRQAIEAIAQVAFDAGVNGQIPTPCWGEAEALELLKDLKGLSWDSMGLGVVIY